MARHAIYNGYVFGVDNERANRVRFSRPFQKADSGLWIDVDAGAITDLFVPANRDELLIECGARMFRLTGRSPYDFQLSVA